MRTSSARWGSDSKGLYIAFYNNSAEEIKQMLASMEEGKEYELNVNLFKRKRSLDANAYAWVLIGKLAEKLGESNIDVYKSFIRDVGGNYTTMCMLDSAVKTFEERWHKNGIGWVIDTMPSKMPKCTNVLAYCGSSNFDSRQMGKFIDLIVHECQDEGIETKTPAELALLIKEWGNG